MYPLPSVGWIQVESDASSSAVDGAPETVPIFPAVTARKSAGLTIFPRTSARSA